MIYFDVSEPFRIKKKILPYIEIEIFKLNETLRLLNFCSSPLMCA